MRPDRCCVVHPEIPDAMCALDVRHIGVHFAQTGDRYYRWLKSEDEWLPEDVVFTLRWDGVAAGDLRTIRRWANNKGVDRGRAEAARKFLREHGL